MFGKLIGTISINLLTEKVLFSLALQILEWAVGRTTNKVDDKIFAIVEEALKPVIED